MIFVSSFVTAADRLVSGGDFVVKDLGKHLFPWLGALEVT
jgi:hypothetical protein